MQSLTAVQIGTVIGVVVVVLVSPSEVNYGFAFGVIYATIIKALHSLFF